MRTLELRVTVDASGTGTSIAPHLRYGFIEAIHLSYAAAAAAGTDVTISCVDSSRPDLTILTVANASGIDAWFYPRAVASTPTGVAQTVYDVKLPFRGYLKLAVTDGGNAVADCVTATILYSN